jgi:hypothetical protein
MEKVESGVIPQSRRHLKKPPKRRDTATLMRLPSPLSRSRAPQKLPKKEFELSERSEFSNSRQLRGAQGIRHRRTSDWVLFLLVRFL